MMQAASDIYLGWTKGVEDDRYLYWRQLRDMKGSVVVESDGTRSASTCTPASAAQTLARAHARSGDPIAIAAYLGKKDRFDQSIADFSERYADQNERDYDGVLRRDPIRPARSARRRLTTDPGSPGPAHFGSWSTSFLANACAASSPSGCTLVGGIFTPTYRSWYSPVPR